jgi:hypothetical protein
MKHSFHAPKYGKNMTEIVRMVHLSLRIQRKTPRITTKETRHYEFRKILGFHDVTMKNVVFWAVTLCGSCKNKIQMA